MHTLPHAHQLFSVDCIARHHSFSRSLTVTDFDEYLVFPRAPHDGVNFFTDILNKQKIMRIRWINMTVVENSPASDPAVANDPGLTRLMRPHSGFKVVRRNQTTSYCGKYHRENSSIIDEDCSFVKEKNSHKWMASTDMSLLGYMPNMHSFIVKTGNRKHGLTIAKLDDAFIAHYKGISRRYLLKDAEMLPRQHCDDILLNLPSLASTVISKLLASNNASEGRHEKRQL